MFGMITRIFIPTVVVITVLVISCGGKAEEIKLGDVTYTDHGTKSVKGKAELELEADDFYFKPTFLRGDPGQTVKLEIENEGTVQHNFSIPLLRLDRDIPPKSKADVEITFPQSGVLRFFCKYHTAQGMNGQLLAGDAKPQPAP